jgi:hypothetical protein
MDHPRRGLTYVKVEELDQSQFSFKNFTMEDQAGEKLGDVEGVIMDVTKGIPYYPVVNAGGWFRSKHFLIPIGHLALDYEARKFIADVPKERVKRFPGFDLDVFPRVTPEYLDRMAEEIARECCPDRDALAHYRTPAWWDGGASKPDRPDDPAK